MRTVSCSDREVCTSCGASFCAKGVPGSSVVCGISLRGGGLAFRPLGELSPDLCSGLFVTVGDTQSLCCPVALLHRALVSCCQAVCPLRASVPSLSPFQTQPGLWEGEEATCRTGPPQRGGSFPSSEGKVVPSPSIPCPEFYGAPVVITPVRTISGGGGGGGPGAVLPEGGDG